MRRIRNIVAIICIMVFGTACQKGKSEEVLLEQAKVQETQETPEHKDRIFVYVCGAVNREGVYELPTDSRVYEAIEHAGGFREDAATTEVNQAKILEDAERLYIPTVTEVLENQSGEAGKININRATKEELKSLPGVGESKADSIIRYRKEQGGFDTIEEIMQISGIKEGLFEKIKERITV